MFGDTGDGGALCRLWRRGLGMAVGATLAVTVSPAVGQIPLTDNTLTRDSTVTEVVQGTVAEMSWLTGHWRGQALGGVVDEVWLEPTEGAIAGMFQLATEEGVQFYEIFAIREVEGSLVLNLKHFNADIGGWEEKEETEDFHLLKLEPRAAYFDGLTYRSVSDNEIEAFVVVTNNDGSVSEYQFRYQRVE
ncbi:MAG: DUF6265 family protein [Longimicrobiales bacterium]